MNPSAWGRIVAVIVVALVLQVGALDQMTVLGAHADVMVLIAICAGLVGGPQRGAMVGFVCGLFADLVVSTPFGLSALCFTLVGYLVGLVRAITQGRDTPSADVAACVVATVVETALFAVIGTIAGQRGMLSETGAVAVMVTALGSLVLGHPMLAVVRWAFADSRLRSTRAVPSGGSALG